MRQCCSTLELVIPTSLAHALCKAKQINQNEIGVGNTLQGNMVEFIKFTSIHDSYYNNPALSGMLVGNCSAAKTAVCLQRINF